MTRLLIGITTGLAVAWLLKFLFDAAEWPPQSVWFACAGLFIVLFAIIWTSISIENKFWPEEKK